MRNDLKAGRGRERETANTGEARTGMQTTKRIKKGTGLRFGSALMALALLCLVPALFGCGKKETTDPVVVYEADQQMAGSDEQGSGSGHSASSGAGAGSSVVTGSSYESGTEDSLPEPEYDDWESSDDRDDEPMGESIFKNDNASSSDSKGQAALEDGEDEPAGATADDTSDAADVRSDAADSKSVITGGLSDPADDKTANGSLEENGAGESSTESDTDSKAAAIDEHGNYTTKEDVSLYLHTYQKLPSNFITKKQARSLGWSGGGLDGYADGCSIGGDVFGNYEGLLPEEKGRTYWECDINTMHKKSRGAERIVFSSDGLIFYTNDHYDSFTQLY